MGLEFRSKALAMSFTVWVFGHSQLGLCSRTQEFSV